MKLFFDTSAVVPLLIEEPHTQSALSAWAECTEAWAWNWMRVEAEAALARRRADSASWNNWRRIHDSFEFIDFGGEHLDALCAFNRSLALRAADAAHLYLFDRILHAVPDLQLITFDRDMRKSAGDLRLPLYAARAEK